jgi:hypothetical protein
MVGKGKTTQDTFRQADDVSRQPYFAADNQICLYYFSKIKMAQVDNFFL